VKSIIIQNLLESTKPGYFSSFIAKEYNIARVFFFVPSLYHGIDYSLAKNSEFLPLFHDMDYSSEDLEFDLHVPKSIIEAMEIHKHQILSQINRWRNNYHSINDWHTTQLFYYKLMSHWYNFLIQNNVVCFFMSTPHAVDDTMIRYLCNVMDIMTTNDNYYDLEDARKIVLTVGLSTINIQAIHETNLDDDFFDEYQNLINPSYSYSKIIYKSELNGYLHYVKYLIKRVFYHIKRKKYRTLFIKLLYLISNGLSEGKLYKFISKIEVKSIDKNLEYYYLPLHFQPEATTSLYGEIYENQLAIVHTVSSTLPKDRFLVVKEHPAYWKKKHSEYFHSINEYRSKEFYKALISMNNVVLIDHNYDSNLLIESSLGVITVNGSVSLEALKHRKPLLLFGNHFFRYLPNSTVYQNVDSLIKFYNLSVRRDFVVTNEEIMDFFRLIQLNSYTLLDNKNVTDDKNLLAEREKIAKLYLRITSVNFQNNVFSGHKFISFL
jgi:hypothetical protein